jgi:hypothetical protein
MPPTAKNIFLIKLYALFSLLYLSKVTITAITTQCLICYDINPNIPNFISDIFFIFKTAVVTK